MIGTRLVVRFDNDSVGIPLDMKDKLFENTGGKGPLLIREVLTITDMDIKEMGECEKGVVFLIHVPPSRFKIDTSRMQRNGSELLDFIRLFYKTCKVNSKEFIKSLNQQDKAEIHIIRSIPFEYRAVFLSKRSESRRMCFLSFIRH